jgi:hypothetical protein
MFVQIAAVRASLHSYKIKFHVTIYTVHGLEYTGSATRVSEHKRINTSAIQLRLGKSLE